jgi:putative transposase
MTLDNEQQIALWRYEVIAPLLALPTERGAVKRAIERLSLRVYEHPHKGSLRLGFGTIEEWLYAYKRDGLDGLRPASRKDRGTSRVIDDVLAEAIERLARQYPDLDGRGILAELRARLPEREDFPALRTLYRFLKARGLSDRRRASRRDHRAFSFDLAGDCWQADVMYGPSLPMPDGRRGRTYLIAILDDASRLICHAEFYDEQHLRSLRDCLKQALLKRGVPRRLYMDNGRIFRSRLLLLVAARLGIQLLHTRPFMPQGRAKLERFFGSLRRGFLRRVDSNRVGGLDALNRLLFAWVEGEYHVKPHRGLDGETPLDRWMRLSAGIRPVPRDVDLDVLLLEQASRRVAKDGTFALKGRAFEAGPDLIGRRVDVRFDPFDLRRALIVVDDELRPVFPVDLRANRHVRRRPVPETPSSSTPRTPLVSLQALASDLDITTQSQEETTDGSQQDSDR